MSQFEDLAAYLTTQLNGIIAGVNDRQKKEAGKGLSTEDYTTTEKNKLAGIDANAQANQNAFASVEFTDGAGDPIQTIAANLVSDALKLSLGGLLEGSYDAVNRVFTITGVNPPDATTSSKGIVQVGSNLNVSGGTVSVDTTQVALRSYVDTAIDNLVNSAPGTLDTLQELADALGNDPNLATTLSSQIAAVSQEVTDLETAIGTVADFSDHMDANLDAVV